MNRYSENLRIGLLSDTHGFLDGAVFDYFADCDEVWHAGDFGPVGILDELKNFKPVRGVWGNIDGAEVRASVPESLDWECKGMKIFMTHIAGYPGAWDKQAKATITTLRPDVVICGHSHILKVMRDKKYNLLHLNPGAAGHNGWHIMRTMLRFEIDDGKMHNVEAIELGPRGRSKPLPGDTEK
jgi:putative phosphoesterase